MVKKHNLKYILTNTFIKFGLIPIVIISSIFIATYYYSSLFLVDYNSKFMIKYVLENSNKLIKNDITAIKNNILHISRNALLLQAQYQNLFKDINSSLPTNIEFATATNGVYYQTTKDDTSLYYSSDTKIGQRERDKALLSHKMKGTLKSIVDNNPMIVASYFNSWDNMSRYYPFIDNVYNQFGSTLNMEEFEFYYLADKKHNPSKGYVWTDTYLDPAGKGWMLSCIVPIYNGDFLEGVSGMDITIDNILKHITNKKISFDAKMAIVNNKGKVLAISKEIEKLFNNHSKKILDYDDNIIKIDNIDYMIIKKVEPTTDWTILIFIKHNNILENIYLLKEKINDIIYLSIIFIIIFLVIYGYILLKIFRQNRKNIIIPINQLTQQTILVGDGYDFIDIKESEIYEIDKLHDNFKIMMNTLNKHKNKLIENNNSLENRIKEQVNEALLKDKQIQKYSKHAQMGEMIGMIAHQWRQPLTSISAISSNISLKAILGTLNNEIIEDGTNRIVEQCQQMSDTINTFINFVKPSNKKKSFKIAHSINNIIEIMGVQLVTHNIDVNRDDIDEELTLIGYEDLLEQVIINILANSRDAFDELNINNKVIKISVKNHNQIPLIIIEDNAGGIDKKVKDRIFNPYFTTKKEGKGTGLGLYMSLDIMRKSFNGDLTHKNSENGSIFSIFCGEKDKVD